MNTVELKIAQSISSLGEVAAEYTPSNGKKVQVNSFTSTGERSANILMKIYWKYGQAGETLIWTMSGGDFMPFTHKIPDNEVNGTNKLAITIENLNLSSRFAAAFATVEVN